MKDLIQIIACLMIAGKNNYCLIVNITFSVDLGLQQGGAMPTGRSKRVDTLMLNLVGQVEQSGEWLHRGGVLMRELSTDQWTARLVGQPHFDETQISRRQIRSSLGYTGPMLYQFDLWSAEGDHLMCCEWDHPDSTHIILFKDGCWQHRWFDLPDGHGCGGQGGRCKNGRQIARGRRPKVHRAAAARA